VHPERGTLADFERLVARGAELGVEVAIDFAIQCSPDHPWLREHPDWFHHRPDGTLKYAENPPKRYQDIYNVNFDSEDWRGLWQALLDVVLFWTERGVRIFRVDNPHTKPVAFWEWLIREVRGAHPDVVFLAEAFTTPARMATLAKAGFSQSYTHFTWKNTKAELSEFLRGLTQSALPEFFRPNFFVNTPDILTEYLQEGGQPAFEARLVLAATLSPSYGVYSGYENVENVAVRPGCEEYVDSEKYEAKERTIEGPLLPLVRRLNRARRENAALRRLENQALLETANESLIAYSKCEPGNSIIVCGNLDPHTPGEGLVTIPPELGLPPAFRVRDLLTAKGFAWKTGGNYVALDPGQAHLLRIETA
jgi:starch synthase (maltosyl-transferring)